MTKSVPFKKIETWLEDLPEWKSRLDTLQIQLTHIPGLTQKYELVAIHGEGQKNEAVLNEVIRRLQSKEVEIPLLQIKIQTLETAVQHLLPDEQQFIEHKYRLMLSTPLIMEKLALPSRSFYRLRRRTFEHLYRLVGGEDSLLGLELNLLYPDDQ